MFARHLIALAVTASLVFTFGCAEKSEPKKAPKTVREKAEAVGKFSDRIMTRNLEKNLTGVVDSAERRAEKLKEAAGE